MIMFCDLHCLIIEPVSYTHLDVYKRQAHYPLLSGSRSNKLSPCFVVSCNFSHSAHSNRYCIRILEVLFQKAGMSCHGTFSRQYFLHSHKFPILVSAPGLSAAIQPEAKNVSCLSLWSHIPDTGPFCCNVLPADYTSARSIYTSIQTRPAYRPVKNPGTVSRRRCV